MRFLDRKLNLPLTMPMKLGYNYKWVRGEAIKFRPYDFIFGSGP